MLRTSSSLFLQRDASKFAVASRGASEHDSGADGAKHSYLILKNFNLMGGANMAPEASDVFE